MITIPDGFIASTTAYIGELFVDLWVIVALVVGIPLGFWVLRKITSLFRFR